MKSSKIQLFWFRRDLRHFDNAGLYQALKSAPAEGFVQPIFIFDTQILGSLSSNDKRLPFLQEQVSLLKDSLQKWGSDLWVFHGSPEDIFRHLLIQNKVTALRFNHDYEPKAIARDHRVSQIFQENGVPVHSYKDQVIFEKSEILTDAGKPYTVYTPYAKKWRTLLSEFYLKSYPIDLYIDGFVKRPERSAMPDLQSLGFNFLDSSFYPSTELSMDLLKNYQRDRDFPSLNGTSRLGLHLRFGTLSIRELAREALKASATWLSELIWREFFMQILFHFPQVEEKSFRPLYDQIAWRDSEEDFEKWQKGQTGYPLVDAGMRELRTTGHMHNRVRMLTASFLTKHLLIHWRKGERHFASELLDFDLAANNGNWQWAAGSGCDAAPYFRIFNPTTQLEKFDPQMQYVKKWVPEFGTKNYTAPMIEHSIARDRCLNAFHKILRNKDLKK